MLLQQISKILNHRLSYKITLCPHQVYYLLYLHFHHQIFFHFFQLVCLRSLNLVYLQLLSSIQFHQVFSMKILHSSLQPLPGLSLLLLLRLSFLLLQLFLLLSLSETLQNFSFSYQLSIYCNITIIEYNTQNIFISLLPYFC